MSSKQAISYTTLRSTVMRGDRGFSWAPHSSPGLPRPRGPLGAMKRAARGQQPEPATPHSHQNRKRHPPWASLLGHFLLSSIPSLSPLLPATIVQIMFVQPLHPQAKPGTECFCQWGSERDGKAPTEHRGSSCEVDLTDAARPRSSGHLQLASRLCKR